MPGDETHRTNPPEPETSQRRNPPGGRGRVSRRQAAWAGLGVRARRPGPCPADARGRGHTPARAGGRPPGGCGRAGSARTVVGPRRPQRADVRAHLRGVLRSVLPTSFPSAKPGADHHGALPTRLDDHRRRRSSTWPSAWPASSSATAFVKRSPVRLPELDLQIVPARRRVFVALRRSWSAAWAPHSLWPASPVARWLRWCGCRKHSSTCWLRF